MLTVKALNADTSFLVTFSPSAAAPGSPGVFTILIDPWLSGPARILSSKFSISQHKTRACVASLADLPEPDMVLISQDKPDHCHEETLRTLPARSRSLIVAAPAAARKMRRWNHFDARNIHALQPYSAADDARIFRLEIPSLSCPGTSGEVTVALMPAKRDISGLHNAVGITYRAPRSLLSPVRTTYINLPPTPPLSPPSSPSHSPTRTRVSTAVGRAVSMPSLRISSPLPLTAPSSPRPLTPCSTTTLDREPTLSLIYSPHGVAYSVLAPYASKHLVQQSALPLTALLHSFDRVDNPWYLGGNIAAGEPGGSHIARRLMARCWVGAHDEQKENRGVSVSMLKVKRMEVDEVRRALAEAQGCEEKDVRTMIARLGPGENIRLNSEAC